MSFAIGNCGKIFRDGYCPDADSDDLCMGCDYNWSEDEEDE